MVTKRIAGGRSFPPNTEQTSSFKLARRQAQFTVSAGNYAIPWFLSGQPLVSLRTSCLLYCRACLLLTTWLTVCAFEV
jgi:hypothetical protein